MRKVGSGVEVVPESAILCAELVPEWKFVHDNGILCAKLMAAQNFVLEMKVICAELSEKRCFAGGPHLTVGS